MSRPMVRIHNTVTGEIVDREMTNVEFTQYETDQAYFATQKIEVAAKATAKAALLTQLGITEEQAKLLLS